MNRIEAAIRGGIEVANLYGIWAMHTAMEMGLSCKPWTMHVKVDGVLRGNMRL